MFNIKGNALVAILGLLLSFLIIGCSSSLKLPKRTEALPQNIDTSTDASVAKLRANSGFLVEGYCEKEADEKRAEILNTPNTEELYEIKGTKYYISQSGDDRNDGLTPETPIKTMVRLMELYIVEGDAVLFNRGDTFRLGHSLSTHNGVTYGAYGKGSKPKIYGSLENYAKSDKWEAVNDNIWKIPLDYDEACGLVINHSEIIGVKKTGSIKKLKNNGDYLHDTKAGIFYLYCDKGNPKDSYYDIEIMPSVNIISAEVGNRMVTIDNLCIKYSAGFGIHSVGASNFTVTNCEFGFLGGRYTSNNRLRYGNAVEFWNGGIDIKVENNWFYQTYDSALTWQGDNDNEYLNISFSGNLFEYNNADIEFFSKETAPLENFTIKDNLMRFTSMGWGTRKNDGGIRGIEGCIRGVTGSHPKNPSMTVKNVQFINNTIDCPARQIINWSWEPEHKSEIHTKGTRLYIKDCYRTKRNCLQGLQTKKGQSYYKSSSTDLESLKTNFEIFETGAQIYWYK